MKKLNHICPTCGIKTPVHVRTLWKKERFKMFNKVKNEDSKLIDIVRKLCKSSTYKDKFLKYYDESKFNLNKEIKNLYLLVTDKRQKKDLNEVE